MTEVVEQRYLEMRRGRLRRVGCDVGLGIKNFPFQNCVKKIFIRPKKCQYFSSRLASRKFIYNLFFRFMKV